MPRHDDYELFLFKSRKKAQHNYNILSAQCGLNGFGQPLLDELVAAITNYFSTPPLLQRTKPQQEINGLYDLYQSCMIALAKQTQSIPGPRIIDKSKQIFDILLRKGRENLYEVKGKSPLPFISREKGFPEEINLDNNILGLLEEEGFYLTGSGMASSGVNGAPYLHEGMGYDWRDDTQKTDWDNDWGYAHDVIRPLQNVIIQCLRNTAFTIMKPACKRQGFKLFAAAEYNFQLAKQLILSNQVIYQQYQFAAAPSNLFIGQPNHTAQKNYLALREKCGKVNKDQYSLDNFVLSFREQICNPLIDNEWQEDYRQCISALIENTHIPFGSDLSEPIIDTVIDFLDLMKEYGQRDLGIVSSAPDLPVEGILGQCMKEHKIKYCREDAAHLLDKEKTAAAAIQLLNTAFPYYIRNFKIENIPVDRFMKEILAPLQEVGAQCLRNIAFEKNVSGKRQNGFKSFTSKDYDEALLQLKFADPDGIDTEEYPSPFGKWRYFHYRNQ